MAVATLSSALVLSPQLGLTNAEAKSLHRDHKLMRGEVQQFGDWLVGCDNHAKCEMIGFLKLVDVADVDKPASAEMSVRITFGSDTALPPAVEIHPVGASVNRCGSAGASACHFQLRVGGVQTEWTYNYSRRTLTDEESNNLLTALKQGSEVIGVDGTSGRILIRFPYDQFERAARATRLRQAKLRSMRVEASMDLRLEELPDGSLLPVQPRPRRLPAKPEIVSGFVPILAARKCGDKPMRDVRRYRFIGNGELWSYVCDEGGEPSISFWEMSTQPEEKSWPLSLPEPRDTAIQAGTLGLMNAVFDWDFGILRSYQFVEGHTDCGTFRAWGFTQSGWQLIERREMPLCRGLEVNDWILTHLDRIEDSVTDE